MEIRNKPPPALAGASGSCTPLQHATPLASAGTQTHAQDKVIVGLLAIGKIFLVFFCVKDVLKKLKRRLSIHCCESDRPGSGNQTPRSPSAPFTRL